MKKHNCKILFFSAFAALISASSYAQEKKQPVEDTFINDKGQPSMIVFNKTVSHKNLNASTIFKQQLKTNSNDTFVLVKSETDELGFTHQKYQQFYNGIPVEFATYALHSKNGKASVMNGDYYNLKGVNTTPTLNKKQGFQFAKKHIGAEKYLWEDKESAKNLGYSKPSGELVLLPNLETRTGKKASENAKLAYKYNIYAIQPLSAGDIYIDAISGEVLLYNATIKHLGEHAHSSKHLKTLGNESEIENETKHFEEYRAVANVATRYSGSKYVTTKKITENNKTKYILRDGTRKTNTYNSNGTNTTPITDFKDNNNNWTAAEYNNTKKDNAALDVHWGTEKVYDYWDNKHSRNSYNDSGAPINSWVHYDNVPGGAGYDNAFWNGSAMIYGDGTSNGNEGNGNFDALTSLDVVAHEIGHAVTQNTANLVYQKESGALNEGFSDIWAAAVEHYAKGNGNNASPNAKTWLIGDEIDRRTNSAALRSMKDPKSLNQPDTYGGGFWKNPNCNPPKLANDYCGVHTNSGVLNYWFYLTVAGGSGTNDKNKYYNVTGIGMDKAAKIAFRTLNTYLSSTSKFINARHGSIQAAKDLYGAGSAEQKAVTNAWYAVNVGNAYSNGQTTVTIKKNTSNYSIDGDNGGANNRQLRLYNNNNHVNQQWIEIHRGGDFYSYKKKGTNFCIDGGSTPNPSNTNYKGTAVKLYTCANNQQNQHWKKVPVPGTDRFRLLKRNAQNYSIDGKTTTANNVKLHLWSSSTTNVNQQWRFNALASRIAVNTSTELKVLNDKLFSMYPNPSKGETTFNIVLKEKGSVSLAIYDVNGRQIALIANEVKDKGAHTFKWSPKNITNGLFIVKLITTEGVKTSKLLINK